MIEVFRIPISKAQLAAMPVEERDLLLLASHASNQVSVQMKLLILSSNQVSSVGLEEKLSAAQTQMILRSLIGVLAEAWELTKRFGKVIGTVYVNSPQFQGQDVYARLKKHFGQSNLLHSLRNLVSYHHPGAAEMEAAFQDAPEHEDWAWYVSEANSNTYYFLSDMVISTALMRATGEQDTAVAFGNVMREVMVVSNDIVDFFALLMRAIVGQHLSAGVLSPVRGTGEMVEPEHSLNEFALPFFMSRYASGPRWRLRYAAEARLGVRWSDDGVLGL